MPLTDRTQAKEAGFAQVREVLQKFKGLVTDVQFGTWGGNLIDPKTHKPVPPKEFMEVTSTGNVVLESTEPLSMDITEKYTFRVNCSDFKGSFWVEMFLASADAHKVLIPGGLKNKMITWEKATLENENPEYNKTDWVIAEVADAPAGNTTPAPSAAAPDPKALIADLAVGKTDAELQAAIDTAPGLMGSNVLPLAKSGMLTQALIKEGKLVLAGDGKYQKP